jgi:hypothetical protein
MTAQLVGETAARAALSAATVDEMAQLFAEHYELACLEDFRRDLAEKDQVVLLREAGSGLLQGFSTLAVYTSRAAGSEVGVVYSGDTIIRPAFWGTPALPSVWIQHILALAAQLPQPVYWLLISSGYKSYRFLPVFYREYYPHLNCPTPPETQHVMDRLACERFGQQYNPATGIVRFAGGGTPLRSGVADVNEERQRNPHIRFFLERNPGHAQGDELLCLTQISWQNLTAAGQRMATLRT